MRTQNLKFTIATIALCMAQTSGFVDSSLAGWLHSDWQYRVPFSARADSISGQEILNSFPMLVSLSGTVQPDVFDKAKSDGTDLIVTGSDGTTVLDRELVSYDSASREAEIWVRVPQLSKTSNTFFLYYGNPDTTIAQPGSAVWDPSYRAVYHFADDPGSGVLIDSSPQGANATSGGPPGSWSSSDLTQGQIHEGWYFNGVDHHLASSRISTETDSYTISAWLLNTNRSTDFFIHANPGYWHVSSQVGDIWPWTDYVDYFGAQIAWGPNPLPINDGYHHFAWVFDGVADTVTFYYDGSLQARSTANPGPGGHVYSGRRINPQRSEPVGVLSPLFFNEHDLMTGGGDEFRVREGAVSSDWLVTEYRNQKTPQDFLVFGAEETPVATAPMNFGSVKKRFRN